MCHILVKTTHFHILVYMMIREGKLLRTTITLSNMVPVVAVRFIRTNCRCVQDQILHVRTGFRCIGRRRRRRGRCVRRIQGKLLVVGDHPDQTTGSDEDRELGIHIHGCYVVVVSVVEDCLRVDSCRIKCEPLCHQVLMRSMIRCLR